ncbi:histidinol-phosphate transaminase [Marinilabiliaceae bacterium JC017]|nr:histidinol-phosphate transaminase [Marinilabiliaceae bacterium JC017]
MKSLELLLRSNIRGLKPYSSARDEYSGEAAVFLDANENPFNEPYNRYPDPYQRQLKERISQIKKVPTENIFLGNGSDEAIDLVYRAFCEPGIDNVVSIDPSYGMYQVAADINNVEVKRVPLTKSFEPDVDGLLDAVDTNTKLLFLCSPNNPTGNCFKARDIEQLLITFQGIVVLDEAYIDFAPDKSFLSRLNEFPNLVILQTFSKAWGMAGIRLGMAFASEEIVTVLNKIKYPYNVNILTQQKALELLKETDTMQKWVNLLLEERTKLIEQLKDFQFVQQIYPTDANFILVKINNAKSLYNYLVDRRIIIRDRSKVSLCNGCVRITVGSPEENSQLTDALKAYNDEQ